jgi:Zinc finger, C2H2 type/Zinc-finger of C2H2 type
MSIKKLQKVAQFFSCEICDYITSRKSSYDKHVLSGKHQKSIESMQLSIKSCKKLQNYTCEKCNKNYKDPSGLWRHNKKCIIINSHDNENKFDNNDTNNKEQLMTKLLDQNMVLINQNNEFKQLITEQNQAIIKLAETKNYTSNTNVNSNNKFNLNFYLNETCKNAINIKDFVNSLKLTLNDLEETARLGYAGGISKIFINGLNNIDVSNRPVHCSDLKREIMYIKDDDKWIKDTDDKTALTNAIKSVANKNMQQIIEWKKLNPDYNNPDSKQNDKYIKIICGAISGSTKEESESNYEKIIRKVAKETFICK